MGMAASQARLLCITARIHDVEYQAQSIQNAKLQLATQQDQAYQEYNKALDATTLTVNSINIKSGETSIISANFNNLCSKNRVTAADGNNFALRDSHGRLVVEDDIEEGFYEFQLTGLNDPYEFALFMLCKDGKNNTQKNPWDRITEQIKNNNNFPTFTTEEKDNFEDLIHGYELENYKNNPNDKLTTLYKMLEDFVGEGNNIYERGKVDNNNLEDYDRTLKNFRHELYKQNAESIYTQITENDADEFNSNLFNYYVSVYNQIQVCGGCVSIADFDGPSESADASSDTEWLQAMIRSGLMSIEIINTDSKSGEVTFTTTSPSSDSSLTYSPTSSIDKRALAKAEAEYEHKLKQIDKKDQQFDLSLSKLETERSALKAQYDSTKKVIEDNIDRTFKIFS